MICRINKNIKKECSPYVLPDVREIYLLNYSDFDGYDVDNCEYCLDWDEQSKWYKIDVENASFADALSIGNNQNKYRNVRLTFLLFYSKDACVEEAYNNIVLGKYVAVFFANGVWYVSGLLNGMTVNESASDSESHTITLEENTTLTSQILNAECAQDVVDSANGEEPEPPIPPTPTTDYILAAFDVDDTSEPTQILYYSDLVLSSISSLEIDGVEQPSVVHEYVFDTTGLHFVKYNLVDNTIIVDDTFNYCERLIDISLPDTITTIGDNAFSVCSGLTSITIPNSVTTIGEGAFSYCYELRGITIPNSVRTIGDSAFYEAFFGDISYTITIPSSVTSIGSRCFEESNGILSLTFESTTPPTLGSGAFDNMDYEDCPIYVPAASVQAYKTATNWSNYASRIQSIT